MKSVWLGWILCGLVIAFLLLDGIMKVIAPSFVLEAGQSIGFPGVRMNRGLGLLLLACTLLYIVPRTSVLGAILVTAYLGGAVATHVRLGHPLFSRFAAAKRMHPMSGGIGRVRLDSFSDYRELRKKQFGVEQLLLPKSLALSKADADLNRRVKIAM